MRILLLAVIFVLPGCFGGPLESCRSDDFDAGMVCIDGQARTFLIHVPEGEGPYDLLIALHGGAGDAENMQRKTGLDTPADEHGVIVIYPQGTPAARGTDLRTWNAVHCCGRAWNDGTDDVAFLDRLIEVARAQWDIDQVGVTGHSNGGMMAHRYGAERAGDIDLIAPVAGSIGGATPPGSAWRVPSAPVGASLDVLIIHATDDPRVPYDGGEGENLGAQRHDASVQEAIDFWNAAGANVTLIATEGGHGWPGGQADITSAPATPDASRFIIEALA